MDPWGSDQADAAGSLISRVCHAVDPHIGNLEVPDLAARKARPCSLLMCSEGPQVLVYTTISWEGGSTELEPTIPQNS